MEMATSITDLTITKATVEVGSAATFRQTINTNFSNYKSEIESKVNNQIKVAVGELQNKVGEWTINGSITAFVGSWQNSWPNTLAGLIGTDYPYSSYGSLTDLIGTGWSTTDLGTISSRLGGTQTKRRVLVGIGTDVRTSAKVNDLICEISST